MGLGVGRRAGSVEQIGDEGAGRRAREKKKIEEERRKKRSERERERERERKKIGNVCLTKEERESVIKKYFF